MNIIITGASGFIGSRLIKSLSAESGVHVFCLTRSVHKSQLSENVSFIQADLGDENFISRLPKNADIIVHLAQSNNYRQFPSKAEDIFNINVRSTQLLMSWAMNNGIKKFIFASSGNVYKQQNKLLNENDVCEPVGYYGATKYSAEQLLKPYQQFFDTYILRIFGVYGPGQKQMTIPGIISRIKNAEEITLASNQGLFFTPLFIDDCINMLRNIIHDKQKRNGAIYNISGNEIIHLGSLVKKICELTGINGKIKVTDDLPMYLMGDASRFKTDFDYHNFTDINKGIFQTLNYESIKY